MMDMCYLLVSSRAALWTLENRAGSCRADCHLFWQYGGHVDAVVQQWLGFGTACCWGDWGVLWPGLRSQCLIQTAAAAAATVRAQSCWPRQISEKGEELDAAFAVPKLAKLYLESATSLAAAYEYILNKGQRKKSFCPLKLSTAKEQLTMVLLTKTSVFLTALTPCNTGSFLQICLELGSWKKPLEPLLLLSPSPSKQIKGQVSAGGGWPCSLLRSSCPLPSVPCGPALTGLPPVTLCLWHEIILFA